MGRMRTSDSTRWRRGVVPTGLALLALTGCAGSDALRRIGEESRMTQLQVAELTRATVELRKDVSDLRVEIQAARQEFQAALRDQDGRQAEAVESVRKRVVAAEARLETVAGAVRGVEMTVGGIADQVARLEAVPANAAGGRRDGKSQKAATRTALATLAAEELYNRGLESFKGGELGQAILDFEDFVGKHPSHPLAGTAQFWIGEAYYTARDYQHATVEYKKAVDMAPKGEKAPEALFKLGLAHRFLKRNDRAREVWAQLLRDFPQSEAAQKARLAAREVPRGARAGPPADR